MNDRSILDGIRVASACPASWDGMTGDDRARFCASCGKHVYNIAALTTAEALTLVSGREEQPCIRFYRRSDGTVMTADCPVGAAPIARRRRFRRVAAVGAVGLAFVAMGATAVGFRQSRPMYPMPWYSGATVDDWTDWALITLGIRQPPVFTSGMGVITFPSPSIMGTPAVCPVPTPNP